MSTDQVVLAKGVRVLLGGDGFWRPLLELPWIPSEHKSNKIYCRWGPKCRTAEDACEHAKIMFEQYKEEASK